jgi:hypothetical protein
MWSAWRAIPLIAVLAAGVVGCSTGDADGESSAADLTGDKPTPPSQEDGSGACGFYKKKECSASKVLTFYENNLKELVFDTADCLGCAGYLTAAGIIAMGGTVVGNGVLSVPAGVLANGIAAVGCAECVDELNSSGVLPLIDCALVPCEYSDDARQKECNVTCQPDFAFVPKGGTTCQCVKTAKEATCKQKCNDGFAIQDDCTCKQAATTAPPTPDAECGKSSDGFACSPDPGNQHDRACCKGQCVVYECSACDTGCLGGGLDH